MLRRNHLFKALLSLGTLALVVRSLARRSWEEEEWEYGTMAEPATEPVPPPRPRPRPAARVTTIALLTVIFFAGASFTAVAGDQAATLLEEYDAAATEPAADEAALGAEDESATEDERAGEAESEAAQAPAAAGAEGAAPAPEAGADTAADPAPAAPEPLEADPALAHELEEQPAAGEPEELPAATEAVTPAALPAAAAGRAAARLEAPAPTPTLTPTPGPRRNAAEASRERSWVAERAAARPPREPEVEHDHGLGEPTVWLNRALPDPTPKAKRLTPRFAKELRAAARRHGADWAAVLGLLRADGSRGAAPATAGELDVLARRLADRDLWRAALALSGRTEVADRAEALRDLYRAVGLRALVHGLKASKERLVERLLEDERVWVYWGGRSDLETDRIDVRIVVLVLYLAERHESVTVSSLFSGHRKYSRPGVISAHTYGQAVDIAAVGGTSVLGNSQPGGVTEEAVRSVLLLPSELQPQQVISLLGLGGPSFPLADHGDHIHVGY